VCAALRRIGDLAIHIAEIAVRRSPAPAVPENFTDVVAALAAAVSKVTHSANAAIRAGTDPARTFVAKTMTSTPCTAGCSPS